MRNIPKHQQSTDCIRGLRSKIDHFDIGLKAMGNQSRELRDFYSDIRYYLLTLTVVRIRHRKRLWLYSVFFPLFTHKRVVKQLSSIHPLFCWLLKSKHSLIRREHHSLTAHRNIHPTPLISFQNPVAYAIYWAVSEVLSNFSSWFSKPVSKKGKKSDPLSEHRLSAIPLPLLSVNWKKISSQSWPKNRVAEILYSFSLSVEGE